MTTAILHYWRSRKHSDNSNWIPGYIHSKCYIHVQVIYLSSFSQDFSEVLKINLSLPTLEAVVKWAFCLFLPPTSLSWYGQQASSSNMVAMWPEFNALMNQICCYFAVGLSSFSPLQHSHMWNLEQNLPLNSESILQLCSSYPISLLSTLPWNPVLMPHVPHSMANLYDGNEGRVSRWPCWGDSLWTASWEMSRSFTGKVKGKSISNEAKL